MTSLPGSGVTQRPLDISLQTAEATGLLGRRRLGDAVKHHPPWSQVPNKSDVTGEDIAWKEF